MILTENHLIQDEGEMIYMIIKSKVCEDIKVSLESAKRVGSVSYTAGDIKNFCHTINEINRLDARSRSLEGQILSDYRIAKELQALVMPRTITISGNDSEKDIRKRDNSDLSDGEPAKFLTPLEFDNVQRKIYGSFKKPVELVDVNTVRDVDATFTTYGKQGIVKGQVKPDPNYFVPVELDNQQFDDYEYSQSAELCLVRWFLHCFDDTKK